MWVLRELLRAKGGVAAARGASSGVSRAKGGCNMGTGRANGEGNGAWLADVGEEEQEEECT